MAEDRKSFLVYGDIEALLNQMNDEQVAELFRGMVRYFNSGDEPELSDPIKLVFVQIRQQMDRDSQKWEKKREKNRENIRKRWEKKEPKEDTTVYDRIRPYTNNTVTVTDTVTDTVTVTGTIINNTAETAETSSSLVSYLNRKTGSKYRTTQAVTDQIGSLLSAGYTEADIRTVIDKKCAEWMGDDRMRPYLRPSTLFGEHFEEYLAAPLTGQAAQEQDEAERKERARKAKEEQKRREAALDAKWLEENKERLEATRKKYGIPNYEEDAS